LRVLASCKDAKEPRLKAQKPIQNGQSPLTPIKNTPWARQPFLKPLSSWPDNTVTDREVAEISFGFFFFEKLTRKRFHFVKRARLPLHRTANHAFVGGARSPGPWIMDTDIAACLTAGHKTSLLCFAFRFPIQCRGSGTSAGIMYALPSASLNAPGILPSLQRLITRCWDTPSNLAYCDVERN
jgi:hypothetical protein